MFERKRGLLLALAVTILLAGLVSDDVFAQTTVRMWTFLNPNGSSPREVALREIIDRFEAQNPDIRIVVEPQVWDQMGPKFLAAHAAGNAPDVIWVVQDMLGATIEANALADLNELFIKDWSDEFREDITDSLWWTCAIDGGHYCIYTSRNYIGLMYRKDYFEEQGISPEDIQTWDDLLEAAQKLTVRDANGNVIRWGLGMQFATAQADPQIMVPMVLERQGNLFDDDGRALFATEAGIDALQMQIDMVNKYGVTPRAAIDWSAEDLYEQFAAGRLAMINAAVVRTSGMQEQIGKEKVDFMLWPGVEPGRRAPGVLISWAVGVWEKSRVKEAAGRFVEYMTGPEADRVWVELGGQIPMRKSTIAAMPEFFSRPENQFLLRAAEGIANAGWVPPIAYDISGWRQDLNQAMQDAIVRGMSAKEALERAANRFNSRHRR